MLLKSCCILVLGDGRVSQAGTPSDSRFVMAPSMLGDTQLDKHGRMQDFAEVFFPQMASLCNSAKGDALLLLTRNADVFAARLPRDPVTRVIVPLLCRAADQGARLAPHVLLLVVQRAARVPKHDSRCSGACWEQNYCCSLQSAPSQTITLYCMQANSVSNGQHRWGSCTDWLA